MEDMNVFGTNDNEPREPVKDINKVLIQDNENISDCYFKQDLIMEDVEDKTFTNCIFDHIIFPEQRYNDCVFDNCSFIDCNLFGAQFRRTRFSNCNFKNCKLETVILFKSTVNSCKFDNCNLVRLWLLNWDNSINNCRFSDCDFYKANLYDNTITDCVYENCPYLDMKCPEKGSFIGWFVGQDSKKYNTFIKLEIPEDALRSSSTTNKCRCSKAKILDIISFDCDKSIAECTGIRGDDSIYKVGEIIEDSNFDNDRWKEYGKVDFFMTKKQAMNHNYD